MKNFILTTLTLLTAVVFLSANNDPKSTTISVLENEKSVILNLSGLMAGSETLKIVDLQGELVFTDQIEDDKQRIKYDLEKLPSSTYTLSLIGKNVSESFTAILTEKTVNLLESRTYFRPVLEVSDDKILVNALFINEEEIHLNIYNDNGELVFNYVDNKIGSYGKAFNLDHLDGGDYDIVLRTDHFMQELKISL